MNRDLDAEIAEKLYGWKEESVAPDARGEHGDTKVLVPPGSSIRKMYDEGHQLPNIGEVHRAYFCPSHTESVERAIQLWRHVFGPRPIALGWSAERYMWQATTVPDLDGVAAPSLAEAICRLVLQVKLNEVKQ